MTPTELIFRAATLGVVWIALYTAHEIADHWIQTDRQARNKGLPGWPGRRACAAHVATYTATTAAFVLIVVTLFDLPVSWTGVVAGQVLSAGTHYWIDRRFTLQRLCDRLGKGKFYLLGAPREVSAYVDGEEHEAGVYLDVPYGDPQGWDNPSLGTGAYALDQSAHKFVLFAAAILTVLL